MNDEVTLRAEVMELLNSMAEPFDLSVPADIELWRSRAEANQALAREALRMALDTTPPPALVEAERRLLKVAVAFHASKKRRDAIYDLVDAADEYAALRPAPEPSQ